MDGHRTGVPKGPGEQNPAYRPTHRRTPPIRPLIRARPVTYLPGVGPDSGRDSGSSSHHIDAATSLASVRDPCPIRTVQPSRVLPERCQPRCRRPGGASAVGLPRRHTATLYLVQRMSQESAPTASQVHQRRRPSPTASTPALVSRSTACTARSLTSNPSGVSRHSGTRYHDTGQALQVTERAVRSGSRLGDARV